MFCAARVTSSRRGTGLVGVAIVMLATIALTHSIALADTIVPVTLNCYVSATAEGDPPGYDIGWNHAHADAQNVSADITCSNAADGTASIAASAYGWYLGHGLAKSESPCELTIGTTPEYPAGTPLTLTVDVQLSGWQSAGDNGGFALRRGSTLLIDDYPEFPSHGTSGTFTATVYAGEVLTPAFGAFGVRNSVLEVYLSAPEPGAFGLVSLGVTLLLRRR